MTATVLPVWRGAGCGGDPALVPGAVDDLDLDLLDRDRVLVDAEHARGLARRRAQPPGELREVVRGVQPLDGARASRRATRGRSTRGSGSRAGSRCGRTGCRSPCSGRPASRGGRPGTPRRPRASPGSARRPDDASGVSRPVVRKPFGSAMGRLHHGELGRRGPRARPRPGRPARARSRGA